MGDLDELLQSIREEAKRENALTLYKGTRQDDLVDEEVDERILRLLGLEDVFDIDYATYLSLLKERIAAARMVKQNLPTEEAELLTNEFKRVKRNVGRFSIKKKKISINADNLRAPSKSINANKLLPQSKPQSLVEGEEKTKRKKVTDDDRLTKIVDLVTSIRSILEEQLEVNKSIKDIERKSLENQKRKSKEDKSEKKKSTGFLKKLKDNAPRLGILDGIFNFLKNVILGKALVGMLEWMSDPENKKKLDALGRFLEDWWPALTTAFLMFATPLGGFVATVFRLVSGFTATLIKLIPKLLSLVARNTRAAAIIAGAGYLGARLLTANEISGDEETKKYEEGGRVPGSGSGDIVPAMLTPGEFVMSKGAVDKFGVDTMAAINAAGGGTNKPKKADGVMFASGGGPVEQALSELKKDEALSSLTRGMNDFIKPGGRSTITNRSWNSITDDTMIYPYNDGQGNMTIGWGSTYYDDIFNGNKPVRSSDKPITKAEADGILRNNINGISVDYAKRVPTWDKMTDAQKAGMLVVAYNAPYAYGTYKNYTKAINSGNMELAAKEIKRGGPSPARIAVEQKLLLSGPLDLSKVDNKKSESQTKPTIAVPTAPARKDEFIDSFTNPPNPFTNPRKFFQDMLKGRRPNPILGSNKNLRASIDPPMSAMKGATITLPPITQNEEMGNVANSVTPADPDFPVVAPLSSEVRGKKVLTYSGGIA